ncbi:hypothetical protein SprV_0200879700 [Sparganum proliferum]
MSTALQPKQLLLFSAPTELPYSLRRRKFYSIRTSNSEASPTLSPPILDPAIARLSHVETNVDLELPSFLQETIKIVQQLSSGKAPGSDAIPVEIYKHDGHKLLEHQTALFQEMWRKREVPQDFRDADIVHLYKLKDAYRDERPGIRVAYKADEELLNQWWMHFQSRVSTASVNELLFSDDYAPNAKSKGDMQRSMNLFTDTCENFGLIINT